MNLDFLLFVLVEISYLVVNLMKKNFKFGVVEISYVSILLKFFLFF